MDIVHIENMLDNENMVDIEHGGEWTWWRRYQVGSWWQWYQEVGDIDSPWMKAPNS